MFCSCDKWLDVKPQGQSLDKELFSTQKGFQDALIGAYIRLGSSDLYGGNLTWGMVEHMALNWDQPSSGTDNTLAALRDGNYSNAGVRTLLDNTFKTQYKVVADVNAILTYIDENKNVFEPNYYEIIKGEALGLRALSHFTAIQLFGPIPTNVGAKKWLPYVKSIGKEIPDGLTFNEFMNMLLADLDEAERLLENADPVLNFTFSELKTGVQPDGFLRDRDTRINFYSILALKARVFQWLAASDEKYKEKAFTYAKLIIDAKVHGVSPYRLGVESDRVAGDYTMSAEHIFALNAYNLDSRVDAIFGPDGTLFRYDFFNFTPDGFYYLSNLFLPNERATDIRWKDMWVYKTKAGSENYVYYKKFLQRDANPINRIPIIRLSEAYLIATEFAPSKQEADAFYKIYCDAKGIVFDANGFAAAEWENDRYNKILREYVREFYAEGHSFFQYKRNNVVMLPAQWTYFYYNATESKYLVPKPDREIDYNK